MPEIMISILVGAASFALSFLCGQWFRPLGGLVYVALSWPMRVRWIGPVYEKIFIDFFRFSFLFKLLGFLVSSSGILVPLLVVDIFFPSLSYQLPMAWGVLFAALLVSLDIMHHAHLMRAPDFHSQMPKVAQYLGLSMEDFDERTLMQMSRAHFTDLAVINLFIIVICYGVTIYCGVFLGFLVDETGTVVSPLTGVASTFSFLNFLLGQPVYLSGFWGVVLNVFYGASLAIYTVFFIALASGVVDVKPPPPRDLKKELEEMIASMPPPPTAPPDQPKS